jgi:hypothetical protein
MFDVIDKYGHRLYEYNSGNFCQRMTDGAKREFIVALAISKRLLRACNERRPARRQYKRIDSSCFTSHHDDKTIISDPFDYQFTGRLSRNNIQKSSGLTCI